MFVFQTESDVFFQDENVDSLFGEWSSLLGSDEEEVVPKPINPDIGGVFPSPHPELPSNYDGGDIDENQNNPQKRFCSIMWIQKTTHSRTFYYLLIFSLL